MTTAKTSRRHAWRNLLPGRGDYELLRYTWRGDLTAGITVGIVALPLALAFGERTLTAEKYDDGTLDWIESQPDGEVIRHDREPGTTLPARVMMSLLGLLPIEWLL